MHRAAHHVEGDLHSPDLGFLIRLSAVQLRWGQDFKSLLLCEFPCGEYLWYILALSPLHSSWYKFQRSKHVFTQKSSYKPDGITLHLAIYCII
jgi:hypothetical protein